MPPAWRARRGTMNRSLSFSISSALGVVGLFAPSTIIRQRPDPRSPRGSSRRAPRARVEADAALVGAARPVVLDPVAREHVHHAVPKPDRNLDLDSRCD